MSDDAKFGEPLKFTEGNRSIADTGDVEGYVSVEDADGNHICTEFVDNLPDIEADHVANVMRRMVAATNATAGIDDPEGYVADQSRRIAELESQLESEKARATEHLLLAGDAVSGAQSHVAQVATLREALESSVSFMSSLSSCADQDAWERAFRPLTDARAALKSTEASR